MPMLQAFLVEITLLNLGQGKEPLIYNSLVLCFKHIAIDTGMD